MKKQVLRSGGGYIDGITLSTKRPVKLSTLSGLYWNPLLHGQALQAQQLASLRKQPLLVYRAPVVIPIGIALLTLQSSFPGGAATAAERFELLPLPTQTAHQAVKPDIPEEKSPPVRLGSSCGTWIMTPKGPVYACAPTTSTPKQEDLDQLILRLEMDLASHDELFGSQSQSQARTSPKAAPFVKVEPPITQKSQVAVAKPMPDSSPSAPSADSEQLDGTPEIVVFENSPEAPAQRPLLLSQKDQGLSDDKPAEIAIQPSQLRTTDTQSKQALVLVAEQPVPVTPQIESAHKTTAETVAVTPSVPAPAIPPKISGNPDIWPNNPVSFATKHVVGFIRWVLL